MCSSCGVRGAISDSGLCGDCLRGHQLVAEPRGALQDRVLLFHSWAECPGLITSTRVGPDALALRCAECGVIVGRIEPGMLEELLAFFPAPPPRKRKTPRRLRRGAEGCVFGAGRGRLFLLYG
jgi:hypothetical protein